MWQDKQLKEYEGKSRKAPKNKDKFIQNCHRLTQNLF